MGTKLLYSASLEQHLAAYRQELNMQEVNDQWQLLQARIAREGERMGLDQAAIINRIEQVRMELKQQAAKGLASLASTNAADTTTTARKAGAKAFVESTVNGAMSNLEKGKRRVVNTPVVSRALNVQTPGITPEIVQSAKSNLRQTPARESKPKLKPLFTQQLESALAKRKGSPTGTTTSSQATTATDYTTQASNSPPPSTKNLASAENFNAHQKTAQRMLETVSGQMNAKQIYDYYEALDMAKNIAAVDNVIESLQHNFNKGKDIEISTQGRMKAQQSIPKAFAANKSVYDRMEANKRAKASAEAHDLTASAAPQTGSGLRHKKASSRRR